MNQRGSGLTKKYQELEHKNKDRREKTHPPKKSLKVEEMVEKIFIYCCRFITDPWTPQWNSLLNQKVKKNQEAGNSVFNMLNVEWRILRAFL